MRMIKIKIIYNVFFLTFYFLTISSCKQNKLNKPIFEEVNLKTNEFNISFYADYPDDNIFTLWYINLDEEDSFNSDDVIIKKIIGNSYKQEIKFKLEGQTPIAKFRIRPVKDFSVKYLTLDSIKIRRGDKVLVIKPIEYKKYLKFNNYVHWDSLNSKIVFSEKKGVNGKLLFDPFIISNKDLNKKLIFDF